MPPAAPPALVPALPLVPLPLPPVEVPALPPPLSPELPALVVLLPPLPFPLLPVVLCPALPALELPLPACVPEPPVLVPLLSLEPPEQAASEQPSAMRAATRL